MPDKYQSRISYDSDLGPRLAEIAADFNLGKYQSFTVIPVGYEDLNLKLVTDIGTYFVKVFATSRTQTDINRYVGIIETVLEAGIKHPKLLAYVPGRHLYQPQGTSLQLLVMEWLYGKSYWDLGQKPTRLERAELIRNAARLNTLTYHPAFGYDSWAMNNFSVEYQVNRQYLSSADDLRVREVLHAFEAIDHQSLPHGLVHGDLISTNVMKTKDGLYFIDFSVANYLPRIQELAVLLCDLMFDETDENNTKALYEEALERYQMWTPLNEPELKALPVYVQAAHAMHVIPTSKFIAEGEDNSENRHWLNLGRAGLITKLP